jgi:hypothetical protein
MEGEEMTQKRRFPLLIAGALVALGVALSPGTAGAAPSITVTPNSGLPSTADVTVTGTGFFPAPGVSLGQCVAPSSSGCRYTESVPVDPGGAFTASFTVSAVFSGGPVLFNCQDIQCYVGATGNEDAYAPISFATYTATGTPEQLTTPRKKAIARCKKKFPKGHPKRKKCLRKARRLPV